MKYYLAISTWLRKAEGRIAVHKSLGKGVPLHIKVSFTVVCRINHMSEESFKNFGTQKSDAV